VNLHITILFLRAHFCTLYIFCIIKKIRKVKRGVQEHLQVNYGMFMVLQKATVEQDKL
jgi:hypothetical protein